MESSNAILLKIPEKRGESFGYDNYGVKQEYTCIRKSQVLSNIRL